MHSRLWNDASLVKLCWRLVQESKALWSRVLCSKYGSPYLAMHKMRKSSYIWKGVLGGFHFLYQQLSLKLGDGRLISFWRDKWMQGKAYVDMLIHPVHAA